LDPDPPVSDFVMLGYFLGSLFAHATLAAAWTAFGPAPAIWRVPLSFVWVISLPVAIGINVALNGGPDDVVIILGTCLIGQWLLLQLPLGILARKFGICLRHVDKVKQESDALRVRFGIRHLLIVMAVVSVVLGIGRITVSNASFRGDGSIFIFLAVAAIVLTLPLLLAALMRRMAIPGVLLSLVLTAVATVWELPLFESVGGSGPQTGDFIVINVGSAVFILVVAGTVRMNGYCLDARPATGES
jgi:hypothetical protein